MPFHAVVYCVWSWTKCVLLFSLVLQQQSTLTIFRFFRFFKQSSIVLIDFFFSWSILWYNSYRCCFCSKQRTSWPQFLLINYRGSDSHQKKNKTENTFILKKLHNSWQNNLMTLWQLLDDYVCVMVNSNYTDALSWKLSILLKFIYCEKATKFCKLSVVDLTGTTKDKSTVEIFQNFVAFSEYMNFTTSEQIWTPVW